MLDALIAAAEQHNQDLRLAVARVDGACAGRHRPGRPAASLNASARAAAPAAARWPATCAGRPIVENKQAAATLSFELDLWGKLRRANEAAQTSLLSSQANRDAVRLTLLAQVAQGYSACARWMNNSAWRKARWPPASRRCSCRKNASRGGITSELDYRQAQAEAGSGRRRRAGAGAAGATSRKRAGGAGGAQPARHRRRRPAARQGDWRADRAARRAGRPALPACSPAARTCRRPSKTWWRPMPASAWRAAFLPSISPDRPAGLGKCGAEQSVQRPGRHLELCRQSGHAAV